VERERLPKGSGERRQAPACLLNCGDGAASGAGSGQCGDSEVWARWTCFVGGKGLHERSPLDPFHDVVVYDVDAALVGHGLDDGLVGGEMSELDVGRHVLEHLERREGVVLMMMIVPGLVGPARDVVVMFAVIVRTPGAV